MTESKSITIIIASYNDERILKAIASVRKFDDDNSVKIAVIDGGSDPELCRKINSELTAEDQFVSEKDGGVFDALNKGLRIASTEYIGWLGSDDFFTGEVIASDVSRVLQRSDLFIGVCELFSGTRISRKTSSWLCKYKLALKLGVHNPHYSTFGRAELLKAYAFSTTNKAADIGYFLRVFDTAESIATSNKTFVYQAVGGFSNRSIRGICEVNLHAAEYYGALACVAIPVKLFRKALSSVVHKVRKRAISQDCMGYLHCAVPTRLIDTS